MSENIVNLPLSTHTQQFCTEVLKPVPKRRTRQVYSFTDLVQKLLEKEQRIGCK